MVQMSINKAIVNIISSTSPLTCLRTTVIKKLHGTDALVQRWLPETTIKSKV